MKELNFDWVSDRFLWWKCSREKSDNGCHYLTTTNDDAALVTWQPTEQGPKRTEGQIARDQLTGMTSLPISSEHEQPEMGNIVIVPTHSKHEIPRFR